jgi:hypothetical protein
MRPVAGPGMLLGGSALRGEIMDGQAMLVDCPAFLGRDGAVRCGLPAEVEAWYTIGSTDGPLESARIRCPSGHWFNAPMEALCPAGSRRTRPVRPAGDRVLSRTGSRYEQ